MTINLEKALIKENRKLIIPKELLVINEYEKFEALAENDALERVGLNANLKKGKYEKMFGVSLKKQTEQYDQERVFHISKIQAICEKYRLRFLPTKIYKGTIDEQLPIKITTFEIAHNVKFDANNTRIMAPIESFELQEKQKDPLFFYQINSEYFYLIHKWGNDLSLFRSLLPLFENSWFCWVLLLPLLFLPLLVFSLKLIILVIGVVAFGILFVGLTKAMPNNSISWLKPNIWNSDEK